MCVLIQNICCNINANLHDWHSGKLISGRADARQCRGSYLWYNNERNNLNGASGLVNSRTKIN